jgi:hypothetical protein
MVFRPKDMHRGENVAAGTNVGVRVNIQDFDILFEKQYYLQNMVSKIVISF